MNVMEAIGARRSIRAYADKPVETEKLEEVLEAGRLAPSASNKQDWKLIVVEDEQTRRKLVRVCRDQKFVGQAPVVIVACSTNPGRLMPSGQPAAATDLAIALDHMTLAAVELGLGTCWIGAFDAPAVAKLLGVPKGCAVVHILPLGYPGEAPAPRMRKTRSEVICRGAWC